MKNMIILFLGAIAILFSLTNVYAYDLQSSPYWSKADTNLQEAWLNYKKGDDGSYKIDCYLEATEPLDPGDVDELNQSGFTVQSASGVSARGYIKIKDLPNILSGSLVGKLRVE